MTKPSGNPDFLSPQLGQMVAQVRLIPAQQRAEQVRRAELLHDELDENQLYPFDYVYFRLTGYRPDRDPDVLLVGRSLAEDLRRFIDCLSRIGGIAPVEGESVLTLDQAAEELGVSSRTLRRWQERGLRWRWTRFEGDRRRRLTLTRSALDDFARRFADEFAQARGFSRMEPAERQAVIERAKRLSAVPGLTLARVAEHLGRRIGRSSQTIRQIIAQHDREHPGAALFGVRRKALTRHQRRVIERAWRRGLPVVRIARHFRRTTMSIYRVIHERRAARLRTLRLNPIYSPLFDLANADSELMVEVEELAGACERVEDAAKAIRAWLSGAHVRLPSNKLAERAVVFRNFLLWRAKQAVGSLPRFGPPAGVLDQIEADLRLAEQLRCGLIVAYLPLLFRLAAGHLSMTQQGPVTQNAVVEAVLIGLDAMVAGIEQLDVNRVSSIEDRLTWLLMRHFASRLTPNRAARRDGEEMMQKLVEIVEGLLR